MSRTSSKSNAARAYGISQSVVIRWCQKEGQLQGLSNKRKRLDGAGRKLNSLELDNKVYEWIIAQRRLKLPISRRSIQVRARGLALEKM